MSQHENAITLTPLNAGRLKREAQFMDDWFEIGHVDALHEQLRRQMMDRAPDRLKERSISRVDRLGKTCG